MATQAVNRDLQLLPSKSNPTVRRWQRPFKRQTAGEAEGKSASAINAGLFTVSASLVSLGVVLAKRGSHLRKLEGLVPKVATADPKTFRSLLKEGDLIFVESTKASLSSPSGLVMKKAVGSMPHVAIYTGNGKIAHITPNSGNMIQDTIDRWLSRRQNMIVIRPDGEKGRRIAQEASASVGKYNYTYSAIPKAVVSSALPPPVSKEVAKIKNGRVICTTATADILQKAGVSLKKQPGQMLSIDFRSLDNPPVVQFEGKEGILRTSPYQGLGFLIPGLTVGVASAMNTDKVASVKRLFRKRSKDAKPSMNAMEALKLLGLSEIQRKALLDKSKEIAYDHGVGVGFRRPYQTAKKLIKLKSDPVKDSQTSAFLAANPEVRKILEGAAKRAAIGPITYATAATAAGAALANKKQKTASVGGTVDDFTQDMAGRIMAHAFNDELEKLSMEKEAKMSNKAKMILAGMGGFAAGGAAGGAAGYKMEQKRLSPQERKIVNRAMQHAYQQGNMAMYNRLKAMAAQRKAGKSK